MKMMNLQLLMMWVSWLQVLLASAPPEALLTQTKPGCQASCGNIPIPYPFGIGTGCSIDEAFAINCNTSFNPPKPFIASAAMELEVINVSVSQAQVQVKNNISQVCYTSTSLVIYERQASMNLSGTPYTFSMSNNFIVIGCDTIAVFEGYVASRNSTRSCMTSCDRKEDVNDGSCSGVGCCQAPVPGGLKYFATQVGSLFNHSEVHSFDRCGYAFLVDQQFFRFRKSNLEDPNYASRAVNVPVALDWAIGNQSTCKQAQKDLSTYACKGNTDCQDVFDNGTAGATGYRCFCSKGYEGNPYLSTGCQDINECEVDNPCERNCTNTIGSFKCFCPKGYHGEGLKGGKGCIYKRKVFPIIKFVLGMGLMLMFLCIGSSYLYMRLRKKKQMQLKAKFFKQNGGLLLKKKSFLHIQGDVGVETTKIFTTEELKLATKNYDESHIIGKGGYGIVYKGILADKRIVAIKKSKIIDESQIECFINEVVILTQINHRNVVKLLGCCLEIEVPLLVYEFVSNGNLFQHIHGNTNLSWEDRLRIATETASALAYLHSAASIPIIHRDVKSANILLNDKCMAKVSDFGASRLIPLDKNQITTLVQGTLGYLDPEYFQTSQLTEKSDVYSFGVVLTELLTGKKPICSSRFEEQRNLANCFITAMKENCLFQLLDSRIVEDENIKQVVAVGYLAMRCLNLKSEDRPKMKEVAVELDGLRRAHDSSFPTSQIISPREGDNINSLPSGLSNFDVVQSSSYNESGNAFGLDNLEKEMIMFSKNVP